MSSRPETPSHDPYGSTARSSALGPQGGGYGNMGGLSSANDFAKGASGNPTESSPLSQSLQQQGGGLGKFSEDFDASVRGSSVLEDSTPKLQRSASTKSTSSTLNQSGTLSRGNTLKKKTSISRKSSLKRSGSRRSLYAGSIKGVPTGDESAGPSSDNSVFYTPIPTSGSPTDVLANRFQAWRKLLKDLITYFRDVQASYEQRSKALLKVSNVINNTNAPAIFLSEGGINEANRILRDYHKQSIVEANKARDIENEVVTQLSSLRADLGGKIKEIKSLSSDFKNSVEKEKEGSKKAVAALEEALRAVDSDPSAAVGKADPYVVRLGVDRQVERQIDEENYLHRAYLNLEGSGRELESIVIGEIQKAYNALAGILKREADESYDTVDKLRTGPIAMNKDHEWSQFVENDPHFVNPNLPLRRLQEIQYPGKNHPAAAEVRAGMLERKSKYLKSYTPGWYVLSPTHLHEFKSADRIYTQPPVMSLYLPDQKLGSHSQPGSSSHKFILKGRQTGAMHRGHSWVFRAESYDTMLAWYEDIKNLTEKSGEERNAFVRRHARSVSQGSVRSVSDSGSALEEDEADQVPYSANASMSSAAAAAPKEQISQRPSPGGRFPSDIQVNRHLQAPLSPSSGSSEIDQDLTTAAGGFQNESHPFTNSTEPQYVRRIDDIDTAAALSNQQSQYPRDLPAHSLPKGTDPQLSDSISISRPGPTVNDAFITPETNEPQLSQATNTYEANRTPAEIQRHDSNYGEWLAPAAGGAAAGVAGTTALYKNRDRVAADDRQPVGAVSQTSYLDHPEANLNSEDPLKTPGSTLSDNTNITTLSAVSTETGVSFGHTPNKLSVGGGPAAPGQAFPGIARQNTDYSVSDLHVPGEYPKPARTG